MFLSSEAATQKRTERQRAATECNSWSSSRRTTAVYGRRLYGSAGDVHYQSFSIYGADGIDFGRLDSTRDWDVVLTGNGDAPSRCAGTRFVHEPAMYAAGLRYEDLVAACDVVVTKPGYGILSECIANDTAVVYTSRGRFVEYNVLVREMPRYLRCAYLDQKDLFAGRWRAARDAAVNALPPAEMPKTDGADVIAGMISAAVS